MIQRATFGGWDFNTVWDIHDGTSYPFLKGVSVEIPKPPQSPQEEPHIDSIGPAAGAPGIMATINGSNLDGVGERVTFGSVEAEIVSWTETVIVVKVPEPLYDGERTVDVTAGGGLLSDETNSVSFTYKKPVLDSLLPSYGKPGDEVTFKGQHFGEVQHTVEFGRSLVVPKSRSETEIVAKAPWDLGFGVEEAIILELMKRVADGVIPGSGYLLGVIYDLEAGGVEIDWSGGDIDVEARVMSGVGRSEAKRFTFNVYEVIEMALFSPGEPRIVDSDGNITGVVNGQMRREISYSFFADDTALVVNPDSSYRYEVAGTAEGTYGLRISRIGDGASQDFRAVDIPIVLGSTHSYEIGWSSSPSDTPDATLVVDADGDGVFEQTITCGAELRLPVSVDDHVQLQLGRVSFDRRTGQFSVAVTVTNTSTTVIDSPLWLVIESISSAGVTLAGSDGTTTDGKGYLDLTPLLGDGHLGPGETVQMRVFFNNPQRQQFTFETTVRGIITELYLQ